MSENIKVYIPGKTVKQPGETRCFWTQREICSDLIKDFSPDEKRDLSDMLDGKNPYAKVENAFNFLMPSQKNVMRELLDSMGVTSATQ